ncbi:ferredoxin [Paractinoplanes globisporus]|uniref:Ferredoxin n=1 Tax=Paractinoplanes globisporus TaxID=113565 RepID=A0ABW6W958_9ACTN|nr:ferredoxin [Actinoplanes globisporus]
MKLLLDSTRCQGYGLCHEKAPELVDLDEWGYAAITRPPSSPEDDRAARAAIEACPAQALRS